jgi:inosine-uridine nucleoside N-ribohydrolase
MPFSSTKKINKKTPKRGAVNSTPPDHHIITSNSDIYEYIMRPYMTFNKDQNQLKGVRVYDPPAISGHIDLASNLECIHMPFSSTKKIKKKTPKRGAVNGTPQEHHIITSKSNIYEYIMRPYMTFNQDQNQLKGVRVYDPPAISGHIDLASTLE